jgi:hypothetical protein
MYVLKMHNMLVLTRTLIYTVIHQQLKISDQILWCNVVKRERACITVKKCSLPELRIDPKSRFSLNVLNILLRI